MKNSGREELKKKIVTPVIKEISPTGALRNKEEENFHSPNPHKTSRFSSEIMDTRKSRDTTLSIPDIKAKDRIPLFKVNVRTQLLKNKTNPFELTDSAAILGNIGSSNSARKKSSMQKSESQEEDDRVVIMQRIILNNYSYVSESKRQESNESIEENLPMQAQHIAKKVYSINRENKRKKYRRIIDPKFDPKRLNPINTTLRLGLKSETPKHLFARKLLEM